MKRFLLVSICMFFLVALSGCKGVESCPAVDPTPGAEPSSSGEEVSDNMITSDMISQRVYDALQAEWAAWNAKDEMQKVVSSHLPGICYKQFDTWAECEEFLGFCVFNPLEDSEFEPVSYVGMSMGDDEASRFFVNFYGTSEGRVQWIFVESGYRDGDVRITVNAQIFVDTPKDGFENREPLISEDSGERYVATEALLARGPVTYTIRVIGKKNEWDAVRATMEKVLPYFREETK